MTREEAIAFLIKDKEQRGDCFISEALDMAIKELEQEPSGDLISRTEVRKFVEYIQSIKDNHNENQTPINYGTICDIVIGGWNLLKLPSVNPQEPKTGHWIKTIGENGVTSAVRCSECGFEDNRYMLFRYCPNCGAKMERSDKE